MEQINIKEQLKTVLRKENISWQKAAEIVNYKSRSSLRRRIVRYLSLSEVFLNKIGYRLKIVRLNKGEEVPEKK